MCRKAGFHVPDRPVLRRGEDGFCHRRISGDVAAVERARVREQVKMQIIGVREVSDIHMGLTLCP